MTDVQKLIIILVVILIVVCTTHSINKEKKERDEERYYLDKVKDYYRNCYIYFCSVLDEHKKEQWVQNIQKELKEERDGIIESLKILFPNKNRHSIDYDIKYEPISIVFNKKCINIKKRKK